MTEKDEKGNKDFGVEPNREMVTDFLQLMQAGGKPAMPPESVTSRVKKTSKLIYIFVGILAGVLIGAAAYYLCFFNIGKTERQSTQSLPETGKAAPGDQNKPVIDKPAGPKISGLLQFRGNNTRSYYGEGPIPESPRLKWKFPKKMPMCAMSKVGGKKKKWCGTGWTGQPIVWERPDGVLELIFGAYDRKVHFLDAMTGRRTRKDFQCKDIIKGTVTLDPEGFPLLYFGSTDNKFRIVALDRKDPVQLWQTDSRDFGGIWNNDWDANPALQGDILYEGGENGYLYAFKLNRGYGPDGKVKVDPKLLVKVKGWDDKLLKKVGDKNASIENSVALFKNRLYFANSAGRVAGIDISNVDKGLAPVIFDYWVGDDVDASIVIDEMGMLYVAVELERYLDRADEVGQLLKLNPAKTKDPMVWKTSFPPSLKDGKGGIWSTPALTADTLYVTAHSGLLAAVDRENGTTTAIGDLKSHAWSSPVVIGASLLVASCRGEIRNYSIVGKPELKWKRVLPQRPCIESTPAVWKGKIFVGARDGYMYAFEENPKGASHLGK